MVNTVVCKPVTCCLYDVPLSFCVVMIDVQRRSKISTFAHVAKEIHTAEASCVEIGD